MASTSFGNAISGFEAGVINDPVTSQFHQYNVQERPETPPQSSIIISFSRDKDFVERGTILEQLDRKCVPLGSQTALVGLGGVGMANLASTYFKQDQWDAAEELEVQVLEIREKLGVEHADMVTGMKNLAYMWKAAGRDFDAVKVIEQCVQSHKRVLGHNNPDFMVLTRPQ